MCEFEKHVANNQRNWEGTVYINSSDTAGGTQLTVGTSNSSANTFVEIEKKLTVKSDGTKYHSLTYGTDPSSGNFNHIRGTITNVNIDWTIDQYIIFGLYFQGPDNGGEEIRLSSYLIEIY